MDCGQSFRSIQKKRTTNFREDETKLLIQLWGSPQIQNKLYLTHRKEPVMRLLAANMQQRGFYRTPDEIKTRIRNLKCLYHRIRRTVQSGAGIGTVDPDWPHYKAMDRILMKQGQKNKADIYKENIFEGPRCEDIKQEIDDIDINDDMESYTTNSMAGSECEEESVPMPPTLTPAPAKDSKSKEPLTLKQTFPKILPNLTVPLQNQTTNGKPSTFPSIPFPLLILNGVPNAQTITPTLTNDKKDNSKDSVNSNPDMNHILTELLEVQKENLDIERQRLELERQRLDFERFVGGQLLAMGPMLGGLFQRFAYSNEDGDDKSSRKRQSNTDVDFLKESKILKTLLSEGLKKYMMEEDSDNEDSGIHNDENSNDK